MASCAPKSLSSASSVDIGARKTLPEDPGRTRSELRVSATAAQTRIISVARIRLDSRKSVRSFKEIICDDISEFESDHPSHAVGSLPANMPTRCFRQILNSGCCQTWPCQLPGANLVASPKIPSMPAHWVCGHEREANGIKQDKRGDHRQTFSSPPTMPHQRPFQ
jgi:hypothetical protein